jgi:hypothetical protein
MQGMLLRLVGTWHAVMQRPCRYQRCVHYKSLWHRWSAAPVVWALGAS